MVFLGRFFDIFSKLWKFNCFEKERYYKDRSSGGVFIQVLSKFISIFKIMVIHGRAWTRLEKCIKF